MVVLFSLLAFLVFAVTVLYLLIGRERYGSDGSAETLQIGASAGALAKNVLKPEPCRTIRVYFIKPSRYDEEGYVQLFRYGVQPNNTLTVLKALNEASIWLDKLDNRPEQAEIVSRPAYINCPKEIILGRMLGQYDYGDGRKKQDADYMIFSSRNCNYPQPKFAKWFLSQYRRWGLLKGTPDYEGITKQVMRTDIYEEAMKEIGYAHGGLNNDKETLFDGATFDPTGDLEAFAKSFAVNNVKG